MTLLDKSELVRELQARVKLIGSSSVVGFVLKMLDHAPNTFWELPASGRHHPLDERGEHGNLLHTLRVVDMSLAIVDACSGSQVVKDILVAGAILHDLCRHGLFGESERSRKDHPLLVRKLAENNNLTCDYYSEIMRIVENHMGRWGEPPFNPNLGLDEILHLADHVCAHLQEVLR